MRKSLKAIAALLSFIVVYFLVAILTYLLVVYLNGGSVFSPMNWRAYGIAAFANAWAGYLGVVAGHALLDKYFQPYPRRFVGVTFISLLGFWFALLTFIYGLGAVAFILGELNLEEWLSDGEVGQYTLGFVRAIVAIVSVWILLVKRTTNNQTE